MKEKRRNKKKLTTLIALLMCAILAFGIAGSLAYYTSVSESIKNTFSNSSEDDEEEAASVSITLKEIVLDCNTDESVTVGVDEETCLNLLPGSSYSKRPTVTVDDDSIECYVFILVEDTYVAIAQDNSYLMENMDVDDEWELVASYDGNKYRLYRYEGTVEGGESVHMDNEIDALSSLTDASDIEDVNDAYMIFYAYAIQSANVGEETANTQAIDYYNNSLNIDLTAVE